MFWQHVVRSDAVCPRRGHVGAGAFLDPHLVPAARSRCLGLENTGTFNDCGINKLPAASLVAVYCDQVGSAFQVFPINRYREVVLGIALKRAYQRPVEIYLGIFVMENAQGRLFGKRIQLKVAPNPDVGCVPIRDCLHALQSFSSAPEATRSGLPALIVEPCLHPVVFRSLSNVPPRRDHLAICRLLRNGHETAHTQEQCNHSRYSKLHYHDLPFRMSYRH